MISILEHFFQYYLPGRVVAFLETADFEVDIHNNRTAVQQDQEKQ